MTYFRATPDGVVPLTDEDIEQLERDTIELKTKTIPHLFRQKRDELLLATDWTQMADTPQAIRDKYAAYRQALRDVPQQAGFPNNIVWPTKPE